MQRSSGKGKTTICAQFVDYPSPAHPVNHSHHMGQQPYGYLMG